MSDSTSFNPQPVVVAAANNSVPTGTVMIWTQEEIPEGWLECNGQPVPSNYELYKTMKKTPNYQGMFLRGAGSQTINHGNYGSITHGTKLGEVQGDTIRHLEGKIKFPLVLAWDNVYEGIFTSTPHIHYGWRQYMTNGYFEDGIFFDSSKQVPSSNENRPVNIGVKYIIKCD